MFTISLILPKNKGFSLPKHAYQLKSNIGRNLQSKVLETFFLIKS